MILVSISFGGRGGIHIDFTLRIVLADDDSLVSPAKNTLRLKSRSKQNSVLYCLSGRVLILGVGTYFNPNPSNVFADCGSIHPVVRSCNARLEIEK